MKRRPAELTTNGTSDAPTPPLVFHPDDWRQPGDDSLWTGRRRWVAAVRAYADAHNVSSFALMHPDSAENAPYADTARVARAIELARG